MPKHVCATPGEAHGRLAIRFVAIDKQLQIRHGRLGQARFSGTGALAITRATREVVRRACTEDANGKPRVNGDDVSQPVPRFNDAMFQNVRRAIRIVAIDSAADEVASVRAMKNPADGKAPLAPHLEAILRDKAHASRRAVSRPWACDPTMKQMLATFVSGKQSLVQKLSHSDGLRKISHGYSIMMNEK